MASTNSGYVSSHDTYLKNFPSDLFTDKQRRRGFIAVHFIAFGYTCIVLVIVMHSYWKGALVLLLEHTKIRRGIAVSSIIPAGMAMPALAVAITGTFVTEHEVEGFAIVGCSVFNILFVIACCGISVSPYLKIHWYTIWRDNIWFAILCVSLVSITADSVIRYTEAALLLCFYFVYLLILRFNDKVERGTRSMVLKYRIGKENDTEYHDPLQEKKPILRQDTRKFKVTTIPEEQADSDLERYKSDSEVAFNKIRKDPTYHKGYVSEGGYTFSRASIQPNRARKIVAKSKVMGMYPLMSKRGKGSFFFTSDIAEYEDGPKSPLEPPESICSRILWILSIPAVCILAVTIPDCRRKYWKKWWPLTVFMSLLWIGFLSYVLLWISLLVASTFRFPPELAALTILAAGIGMPNLVASVLYCEGTQLTKNNLPVCHSLGSNIFMVCICLGVPWLIESTIKGRVPIDNPGFFYILLFYFAIFLFPFVPQINGWKINWIVSVIFISLYITYIVVSVLIQICRI